jgi:hypothetical protein
MICHSCHAEVSEGKNYCGKCGAALGAVAPTAAPALAGSVRCPECGSEERLGKKFCGKCGAALSADKPPSSRGTPHKTIGRRISRFHLKLPSGPLLISVAVGIVISLGLWGWFLHGVELDLTTDPTGAEVVLDGKPVGKTADKLGSLLLPHLTHGQHTVTVTHPGFDNWSQPIALGWFRTSHRLSVKLPVPSFPLAVITNPGGARVQLDGKDVGVSDESGNLVVPNVIRGGHAIKVMRLGYASWSNSLWIQTPFTVRVNLTGSVTEALPESAAQPGPPNRELAAIPETYWPMKEGSIYRYRTTARNMPGHSDGIGELEVLAPRELNGRRVVPRRSNNPKNPFIFFFTEDNDGISEVAVQFGDNGELRTLPRPEYMLKTPIRLGTAWDDTISVSELNGHGSAVVMRATIESLDEIVTVPAGTFKKCLKVKLGGGTDEMSVQISRWFAPGVGLIKALDERQPLHRSAPFQQQITELQDFKLSEQH